MKTFFTFLIATAVSVGCAQGLLDLKAKPTPAKPAEDTDGQVVARLKDIARFRGVRPNQIVGTGLVFGLEGTGDSKKIGPMTSALANYLRTQHLDVDLANLEPKNAALVMVTAELPPFASNGQRLDVTVTSIGDAKSLRNGTLLMTELKVPGKDKDVFAVASGSISVGGFGASQGGNSQTKGFLTVGRIPGGAIVEQRNPTEMVFNGNKMYIDLDDADATTAARAEKRINEIAPIFHANAINNSTIEITVPEGMSPTSAMAKIEEVSITTDQIASIVVNEKTGTIILGGNVKLAPVAFMYGSLSIRVEESQFVSQPNPLAEGQTVIGKDTSVKTIENKVQSAVTQPNTTVADLAAIFQSLKLGAGDVISILQGLRQQGALKARVVLQ